MVYLSEINTRFGIFSLRWVICASSLRLKHPASEHESSLTSEKRSVLNPVRFGQLVQLPASGKSVSSSFENGTDLRLRKTFCSIHACNLLAGTRLRPEAFPAKYPSKQWANAFSLLTGADL